MTSVPQPADPTTAYTAVYDAWNRLVRLSDASGTVQENAYDARGFRTVRKMYSAGTLTETRHFYYDSDWRCLEERLNSATTADRQYVWGLRYIDDLVLRDRDTDGDGDGTLDERLYALQDANWNVVALTDTAGNVQERYAYDAYGTPSVLDGGFTPRAASQYDWETLFCGYRNDAAGLYHVRHRSLHPRLGDWIERDPAGFDAGMSLYQYVSSSPTDSTDPLGLDAATRQQCLQSFPKPPATGPAGGTDSLLKCISGCTPDPPKYRKYAKCAADCAGSVAGDDVKAWLIKLVCCNSAGGDACKCGLVDERGNPSADKKCIPGTDYHPPFCFNPADGIPFREERPAMREKQCHQCCQYRACVDAWSSLGDFSGALKTIVTGSFNLRTCEDNCNKI